MFCRALFRGFFRAVFLKLEPALGVNPKLDDSVVQLSVETAEGPLVTAASRRWREILDREDTVATTE
jgi:hypothetical protein